MTDQQTPDPVDPVDPDPALEPESARVGRLARARARLGGAPGWAKGAGAVLLALVLIFGIGLAGFAIGQEGGHGEGGHSGRHSGEHVGQDRNGDGPDNGSDNGSDDNGEG